MALPTVNDLDNLLASLNQLKPPGASKNKIQTITALSVNNIQAESSIVSSFYRALKKAPATHKLGALYVIDSVVRQWIEKAKASGQELQFEGRGEPGTYAAAVKRVTELMPALFDDIIKGLPADQKPKLENMVAIWERGSTFPLKLLQDFKAKLGKETTERVSAPAANGATTQAAPTQKPLGEKFMAPIPTRSATPIGLPPRYLYDQGLLPGRKPAGQTNGAPQPIAQPTADPRRQHQPQQPQPPAQEAPQTNINDILAALSKAAVAQPPPAAAQQPQYSAPAPPPMPQIPPNLAALFQQQGLPPPPAFQQPPQPPQQMPPLHTYAYTTPPSAPPMATPAYAPPQPQFPGYPPQQYAPQPPPSIPQAYPVAPPPQQQHQQQQPPPSSDPLAQLRGLLPENILNDREKLVPALQLLQDLQKEGIPPERWGPVLEAFEQQFGPPAAAAPAYGAQGDYGRNRGRSRSPDRGGRGGRGSPVYGTYDANAAKQNDGGREGRNGGGRGKYRQRSPIRQSPTNGIGRPMQPKNIQYDPSLPPDNIKVLSRTLFVGGANGTQQEIQEVFERFGRVQTCIANRDKRHAFVKMTTRGYALVAKDGMEDLQNRNDREVMNVARQTKWGVGFGPRECCDYQRGESIIPIHKLTDADHKWLLTAEYGGTGGKPLEGGMVLEEPDIEIGAGVSSKAMSKRVGPDNNPQPKHQKEGGRRHGRKQHQHNDRDQQYGGYSGVSGGPPAIDYGSFARPEPVAVATPPAVPGFGFSFAPQGNGQNPYR
ncbi:putative RNA recognition motif domain, CID domain, RNA-binding domain superfamily [Septoria linicola]|nr:putative RNA recognition motif domain, CID domain, RNA-binding domain superfamily [Septoria linicola]